MTAVHYGLAAALLCGSLAACSPQQMMTSTAATAAVSATVQNVSTQNLGRLQKLCGVVEPLAETAATGANRTAQVIGQFGVAYCGKLLAGVVPATTDSNTENWLAGLLRQLQSTLSAQR